MSVYMYYLQKYLQGIGNTHYFLTNITIILLIVPPALFLRRIMSRFKLNLFLYPALSFLLLLGLTVPLNFISYYVWPISINIYWIYVFAIELLLLYYLFKTRGKHQSKVRNTTIKQWQILISQKETWLKPKTWAMLFLTCFISINALVFAFTYTNFGGDSAFHAAKINTIASSNEITNRSPRTGGKTDLVYTNNSYHQFLAGISRITNVEPHQVWRDSSYFFRLLTLITLIGIFYYVFNKFEIGVYGGSLFYIWYSQLNTYSYPFELVFSLGWPVTVILFTALLNINKRKVTDYAILVLLMWGLSTLHIGMFALTVFIFAAYILIWLYSYRGQYNSAKYLKLFVKQIFLFLIILIPFFISSITMITKNTEIFKNAVTQVTPYIANTYAQYEQVELNKYRLLYQNLSPLTLNSVLISQILILAYFFLSKKKVIKLFIASYVVFTIVVFSVLGIIASSLIPYWGLVRFNGISYFIFAFIIIEIIILIINLANNHESKNRINKGFSTEQSISLVLILFLILSSGKLASLVRNHLAPGYNLYYLTEEKKYAEISKHIKPKTSFVSNWEIDHWLPTYAPTSSFSIGENGDFLPAEKIISEYLTTYNPDSLAQNQFADHHQINYIILVTPDEDFCNNYNEKFSVIYFNAKEQLCLLENRLEI